MNRAALYVRVSTPEQAREGYSIAEQKERLLAYCQAKGWQVAGIYVDGGFTGSNLNRPGMQKLISETDKFDLVLVYKLDRLSRSQKDTLYLLEEVFLPRGVAFVSMQESFDTSTPLGKAMIGLLAVFAQLEREQIKERTWMGRVARAKAGLYHGGGNIPIGYDYVDGRLVLDPYEAEQVRKIYAWYLSGASFKAISDRLCAEGFTNKYSSYSSWTCIRNILGNETYTGTLHFGGITMPEAHEAIITRAQFEAVQRLRAKRQHQRDDASPSRENILAGRLFCGGCGGRYYLRNTGRYSYFTCYSRSKQVRSMVRDPSCRNKIWPRQELERQMDLKIREELHSQRLAKELVALKRSSNRPRAVSSAECRLQDIDKRINKLMDLYALDSIPPEVISQKISAMLAEKSALQRSLALSAPLAAPPPLDLVHELLENAEQIWDFSDVQQKRRIFQSLIDKVVLSGENIEIFWAF